jgi:hypothetical protein
MRLITRVLAALAAATVLVGATAMPALAATGVITASWGKGSPNFTNPWTMPAIIYSRVLDVYASSTTGVSVTLTASAGCTASQTQLTVTSGATPCVVVMNSAAGNGLDAATATYTIPTIPLPQTADFGSVWTKSPANVTVGKTYVMGAPKLKTDMGKLVTFTIVSGSKLCTVVKSSSKGWLLKVGTKTGKCSVVATAAAIVPNYAALDWTAYWTVKASS